MTPLRTADTVKLALGLQHKTPVRKNRIVMAGFMVVPWHVMGSQPSGNFRCKHSQSSSEVLCQSIPCCKDERAAFATRASFCETLCSRALWFYNERSCGINHTLGSGSASEIRPLVRR